MAKVFDLPGMGCQHTQKKTPVPSSAGSQHLGGANSDPLRSIRFKSVFKYVDTGEP
jgi:hypothetical protein